MNFYFHIVTNQRYFVNPELRFTVYIFKYFYLYLFHKIHIV